MTVFVMKNKKHLRTIAMGLSEQTVIAVIKTIYFLQIEVIELIMYIGPT